jgi:sporulation protein YlmC with PRC-barrel domain
MLRSAKSLRDYHIRATDGNVGRVKDFFFDGQEWSIRYVVVDTSEWLAGRTVLLVPDILGTLSAEEKTLPVELTREQVRNSPDVDTEKPVSRQNEFDLFDYYGWSPYWGAGRSGFTRHVVRAPQSEGGRQAAISQTGDPDLRSMREVVGYSILATDGKIGHVEDFILSEEDWFVRYLAVKAGNWLSGRHVLISPEWVREILWRDRNRQSDGAGGVVQASKVLIGPKDLAGVDANAFKDTSP